MAARPAKFSHLIVADAAGGSANLMKSVNAVDTSNRRRAAQTDCAVANVHVRRSHCCAFIAFATSELVLAVGGRALFVDVGQRM
jgi:hypothetical protein